MGEKSRSHDRVLSQRKDLWGLRELCRGGTLALETGKSILTGGNFVAKRIGVLVAAVLAEARDTAAVPAGAAAAADAEGVEEQGRETPKVELKQTLDLCNMPSRPHVEGNPNPTQFMRCCGVTSTWDHAAHVDPVSEKTALAAAMVPRTTVAAGVTRTSKDLRIWWTTTHRCPPSPQAQFSLRPPRSSSSQFLQRLAGFDAPGRKNDKAGQSEW